MRTPSHRKPDNKEDFDELHQQTIVNVLGQKKILNPYASKNPQENLPATARHRLTQRFSLLNPKSNVINTKNNESNNGQSDEDSMLQPRMPTPKGLKLGDNLTLNEKIVNFFVRKIDEIKHEINKNGEIPDTPRTKMARMFYEKYRINPLETMKTMKSLKKTNLQLQIKQQVHKDMLEFESFFRQCTSVKPFPENPSAQQSPNLSEKSIESKHNQEEIIQDLDNILLIDNMEQEEDEMENLDTPSKCLDQPRRSIQFTVISMQPKEFQTTVQNSRDNSFNNLKNNRSNEKSADQQHQMRNSKYLNSIYQLKTEQNQNHRFKDVKQIMKIQQQLQLKGDSQYSQKPKNLQLLNLEKEMYKNYFFKTRLHDKFSHKKQNEPLRQDSPEIQLDKINMNRKVLINKETFQMMRKRNASERQSATAFQGTRSHGVLPLQGIKAFRPSLYIPDFQPKYSHISKSARGLSIEQQQAISDSLTRRITMHKNTELKTIDIIKECLQTERKSKIESKVIEIQKDKLRSNFQDLLKIHQFVQEDEILESRKKQVGEIYREYILQKQDLVVGKKPKDVLEEFVEQELNDYMKYRSHNSLLYDAIIQKYSNSSTLQRKKRKAKNLHLI